MTSLTWLTPGWVGPSPVIASGRCDVMNRLVVFITNDTNRSTMRNNISRRQFRCGAGVGHGYYFSKMDFRYYTRYCKKTINISICTALWFRILLKKLTLTFRHWSTPSPIRLTHNPLRRSIKFGSRVAMEDDNSMESGSGTFNPAIVEYAISRTSTVDFWSWKNELLYILKLSPAWTTVPLHSGSGPVHCLWAPHLRVFSPLSMNPYLHS